MKCTLTHHTRCRFCGSENLRKIIDFPQMPFTDEFVTGNTRGTEFLGDITITWCNDCRTAQNACDVSVEEYYREYRYTVAGSSLADRFMLRLAERTTREFHLKPGDAVLEVGSGDGRQLKCFQDLGLRVLGFEPSEQLTAAAASIGVPTVQTLFDASGITLIPADMKPAQAILLTYTFDHLPDPVAFLEVCRKTLDPARGILVVEVHDFAKIIERREICLFEHEHLSYCSSLSIARLLERCGFTLISTNLLDERERRGNSLLFVAAPHGSSWQPQPQSATLADLRVEQPDFIEPFVAEVQSGLDRLRGHIRHLRTQGQTVAGYGAGGRGVMTLAMAGLNDSDIAYLCDRNTAFHGLLTPKSHIPVVPADFPLQNPVDEIIVFSFGYLDEIRRDLIRFTDRGGRITSMLDYL